MAKRLSNANIDLHVHPFLGRNSLVDVVNAMADAELDVIALESLNSAVYPRVLQEAIATDKNIVDDKAGLKLSNGKYLLNAGEYDTKENLHVLTIGYSLDKEASKPEIRKIIDKGLSHDALVVLDHPFVENIKTRTAGHISSDKETALENLCKEYSGKIALEWNGYCIPWMRLGLKAALNCFGGKVDYHDVNKKVEEFSGKLAQQGYNLPVVADTDLHARDKQQLSAMGTARIIADIECESPSEIVQSMKKKIFAGEYENVKRYVSTAHLLSAFCLPIIFPKQFNGSRAESF